MDHKGMVIVYFDASLIFFVVERKNIFLVRSLLAWFENLNQELFSKRLTETYESTIQDHVDKLLHLCYGERI